MIDRRVLYFVGGFVAGCVAGFGLAKVMPLKDKGEKVIGLRKSEVLTTGVSDGYRRGSDNAGAGDALVRPVEAPRRRFTARDVQSIEEDRKPHSGASRATERDDILAEREAPIEPTRAEEIEKDIEWADRMTRRENDCKGRKPKIISAEAMGELDTTWDVRVLYYYAYDEVLTTEEGEIIDEVHRTVGDALEKYGFVDDPEQRNIIVQNFDYGTVYEVEKVFAEFL